MCVLCRPTDVSVAEVAGVVEVIDGCRIGADPMLGKVVVTGINPRGEEEKTLYIHRRLRIGGIWLHYLLRCSQSCMHVAAIRRPRDASPSQGIGLSLRYGLHRHV